MRRARSASKGLTYPCLRCGIPAGRISIDRERYNVKLANRRLRDAYRHPGFVPQAVLRSIDFDIEALVVCLSRRRKKQVDCIELICSRNASANCGTALHWWKHNDSSSNGKSLSWQRLDAFQNFGVVVAKHWEGIVSYCNPGNKVALGFVEGLNNKIRTSKASLRPP